MPYQVRFNVDPRRTITVNDQTINDELSVSFIGRNYTNYAPIISENFLHLLENFAGTITPANPVQGQLWFDTSINSNTLKLYNGNTWKSIGVIQKATDPPVGSSLGDLWIDTSSTSQLMIHTGSDDPDKEWLLIGPQNAGDESGLFIRTIEDNNSDPELHKIVLLSAQNQNNLNSDTVAILSRDEFTPIEIDDSLNGFTPIKQGINLPTSINSAVKLHGTATRAEGLIVTNGSNRELISANRFLRDNKDNIVNYQFSINNASGLSITDPLSSNQFSISLDNLITNLSSLTNNADISFNVKNNDISSSALYIDATKKIGIGTTSPTVSLDVVGDTKINGKLTVLAGQKKLLELTSSKLTLSVDVTANNLLIDTISYKTTLPTATETKRNSNNEFIGYIEESSFLKGLWVGTSISILPNLVEGNTKAEQFIMSVATNGGVIIDGYESVNGVKLITSSQQTGRIYRVNKDIPYIYFYAENASDPLEYGLKLYSVLINRSKDLATFTLLANGDTTEFAPWKKITFFKITDNPNDKNSIKSIFDAFNLNWT